MVRTLGSLKYVSSASSLDAEYVDSVRSSPKSWTRWSIRSLADSCWVWLNCDRSASNILVSSETLLSFSVILSRCLLTKVSGSCVTLLRKGAENLWTAVKRQSWKTAELSASERWHVTLIRYQTGRLYSQMYVPCDSPSKSKVEVSAALEEGPQYRSIGSDDRIL